MVRLSAPHQTGHAEVGLIDEGQVLVALSVLDFSHANSVDLAEGAALQPKGNNIFDSIQESAEGLWSRCVCRRPRDFLDYHATARAAIDAAHCVEGKRIPTGE